MMVFGVEKCWFSLVCVDNRCIMSVIKRCCKCRLLVTPLAVSESMDSISRKSCKYKSSMA